MASTPLDWKKGRGKLGPLDPLLGTWIAEAESPQGHVRCTRTFTRVLGGTHVRLDAKWEFAGKAYEELAVLGPGAEGGIVFWSFTSDGKRSEGRLVEAADIHPRAIAFEAEMPAGLARKAYWPDEEAGFRWVVESRTKKGWSRFTEHHYLPAGE